MAKITSVLILFVLFTISCVLSLSCDRDNEPTISENSQNNQGGNNPSGNNSNTSNSSGNNSNTSVLYYFRVETIVGRIGPSAGEQDILFDCNQSWYVTYRGDISGFSYTPTNGKGKGKG